MIGAPGNGKRRRAPAVPVGDGSVDNRLARGGRGGRRGAARRLLARRVLVAGPALLARPALVAGLRTRRAFTGAVGRALCLLAVLAAVGAVKAAALEHDADRIEQLAQPARALLARGQRVVGEGLHDVEAVVALGARVAVSRHENLR